MKKILSILLTLALAAGLAVTALAAGTVEIPSGDNVVKLTDKGVAEDYNGDLYLEFSVKPAQGEDGYLEVPVGTTFKVYWFRYGSFYKLTEDSTRSIDFKKGNDRMQNVKNEDGTVTFTCSTEGEYVFSSSAPASGGWILESTPKIRVTSAPTQPITPPTGDNKVVTLTDTAAEGGESKGSLYLEFSNEFTTESAGTSAARIASTVEEKIEVTGGTIVTVYWFKGDVLQPLTKDNCYLNFRETHTNMPAKSVYNANGTVSFLLEGDLSSRNEYELRFKTGNSWWKFTKSLSIQVPAGSTSTPAGTNSWKAYSWVTFVATYDGSYGDHSILTMSFDKGIDGYNYTEADTSSGPGKPATAVIDVPTGTTLNMTLTLADYNNFVPSEDPVDTDDFKLIPVEYNDGVITTKAADPITSTDGLFSLNQPGYYQVKGEKAPAEPWTFYALNGSAVLIHVTGTAVNPGPGTGGQGGGTGTGGQGGTGGETDPGSGFPPIFPPFTDKHEGYMSGYPDGTIRPNGTVTRAEMVSIIFRLLDDGVRNSCLSHENAYSDVNRGSWYNTAISTIADLDYISGYGDGTFRPDQPITRAEVASIIARFVGHTTGPVTASSFSDVDAQSWYADAVNFVKSKGWMVGDSGKFRPNDAITRAEVMATMNRVLGRSPSKDSFLLVKDDSKFTQWPDNRNKSVWYYADVQEATHSHNYMAFSKGGSEVWTEIVRMRDWSVYSY